MAASQPTEILIAHNAWANQNLIEACAALSDEQFHQEFEMGLKSLHDTIAHILGAMRGWTDLLAGRDWQQRLEESTWTLDQLRELQHEVAEDFEKHVRNQPLDESITRERGGKAYTFTRGGVLTHVTTHGMHHRAQCINMLRHLGVETPPPSSVLEWMLAGN